MRGIDRFMKRRSRLTIIAVSVLAIAGIGLIDYIFGQSFNSALFFVLPVAACAWYCDKVSGIVAALLSGTSLVLSDWVFRTGDLPLLDLWNAVFPFFFFIILVFTLIALKEALAREVHLSRTDPLTGLANRRYFNELASAEVSRSRRYNHPMSMAFIDLDNFKWVNDTLGHEKGDEVLVTVADVFDKALRRTDRAARFGGDEFAIILVETEAGSAINVIDRIRSNMAVVADANGWPVTLSIGLVNYIVPPDSVEQMIKEADALMYVVKESGKGRVEIKTIEPDDDFPGEGAAPGTVGHRDAERVRTVDHAEHRLPVQSTLDRLCRSDPGES
jgi:diguanylate cyclase (GGDEF)-like protein